jgi:hypothetical protein
MRLIRLLVGQRNFYRTTRLLMHDARFDVLNHIDNNGERYVQSAVLQRGD